jgi:tocopherol O-methyltransferase
MTLQNAAQDLDVIEKNDHIVDGTKYISSQSETPAPQSSTQLSTLKQRIRHHYELASDYYYSLWYVDVVWVRESSACHGYSLERSRRSRGEHIHHGYFLSPSDTKESAQVRLIDLLLERSGLPAGTTVLDVGCGIGGTTRHLAKEHARHVVGLTISGRQVEMARKLTREAMAEGQDVVEDPDRPATLGQGSVRFVELDADKMGDFFNTDPNKASFDCVWISEAMSHLADKALFFQNATTLLRPGGKLVVADWFKAEGLTTAQLEADIKPIEGQTPCASARPVLSTDSAS